MRLPNSWHKLEEVTIGDQVPLPGERGRKSPSHRVLLMAALVPTGCFNNRLATSTPTRARQIRIGLPIPTHDGGLSVFSIIMKPLVEVAFQIRKSWFLSLH